MRRGLATEKPPKTRELDYPRARGQARPHLTGELAQVRELEDKPAEEYRAVRLLRASIAGEASARGERARELGRQAHERINADFNVNNPSTPPRASQKLIAAAMLLRSMPAPSTPEAQNLQREAQALIE
jgi:hypothetical protein